MLRIIHDIFEITRPLDGCKILVDFQNTLCDFAPDALTQAKVGLETPSQNAYGKLKLAMVTTRRPEQQYHRLSSLKEPVSRLGIDVGVFYEESWAIDWLMEEARSQPFSD